MIMRRTRILFLLVLPAAALLAQTKAAKTVKRAQPPKTFKNDVFYADAFKEGLVGERPPDLGKPAAASAAAANSGSASASAGGRGVPTSAGGGTALIPPTTIKDTIKSLKQQVDQKVTNASVFAGKGQKSARRDYSLLAM